MIAPPKPFFPLMVLLLFIGLSNKAFTQQITMSGTVRDADTGELLIGATVADSLSATGTLTNTYGFFSITVPKTSNRLKISYVGYVPEYIDAFTTAKSPLDIRLFPAYNLEEVVVTNRQEHNLPVGSLSIPMQQIKSIPALLGEVDVLKALSLTPGVSAGMEGSAGLYVRGGTPDQNLILLDEVPVYNVTHLGGFFSVFNTSSLKSANLYKGAFPARYGGRLASVIDLTMKDGNNQKFGGEVGLGLLNQSLTLEGPIIKNKASFIISGRVSTLGLTSLLQPRRKANGSGEQFTYQFYDLNAKFNYQINKTDQVFISFYNGFDRFNYGEWSTSNGRTTETQTGNNWGNTTGTVRYSKVLSQKLFARLALLYSKYTSEFTNDFHDQNLSDNDQQKFYRYTQASVRDIGGKLQFDYFPVSNLSLKFGLDLTRHLFNPFTTSSNYSEAFDMAQSQLPATQLDGYLDGTYTVAKPLSLNMGIRYSRYTVQNRTFHNPEPRLGINWSLPSEWSVKAGYSVMNQYLHLLSNSGSGFGFDSWLPSTALVNPSRARQVSAGVFKTLPKAALELSLEVYNKSFQSLIDYPEGTDFTGLLAESWDRTVAKRGIGRARGVELMLNRSQGKLTGWISYTWSKSERQFEDINNGRWYPMKYDRRHNVSATASYPLGKKWKLSSTFIYQTGHAVSLPDAAILVDGYPYPRFIYSGRNNGRMPDYHRLDIGATRSITTARKRRAELNFGVFNVYNRNNPLYLNMEAQVDPVTSQIATIKMKQYSLFPLLPYVSYSIKF